MELVISRAPLFWRSIFIFLAIRLFNFWRFFGDMLKSIRILHKTLKIYSIHSSLWFNILKNFVKIEIRKLKRKYLKGVNYFLQKI